MKIGAYDFDIFYKNGKKHTNADAMSRLPSASVNTVGIRATGTNTEIITFRKMQRQEKACKKIILGLEETPDETPKAVKLRHLRGECSDDFFIDKSSRLLYHILHENVQTSREDVVWQLVAA